jgi:hypothetical protein
MRSLMPIEILFPRLPPQERKTRRRPASLPQFVPLLSRSELIWNGSQKLLSGVKRCVWIILQLNLDFAPSRDRSFRKRRRTGGQVGFPRKAVVQRNELGCPRFVTAVANCFPVGTFVGTLTHNPYKSCN